MLCFRLEYRLITRLSVLRENTIFPWNCEMMEMLITFLIFLGFQFFFGHCRGTVPQVSKTITMALGQVLVILDF